MMLIINVIALITIVVACSLRLNIMNAKWYDVERLGLALLAGGSLGSLILLWHPSLDYAAIRTCSRVGVALIAVHILQKHWTEISAHFIKHRWPERRKCSRLLEATGRYRVMK